ncbi:hypothetical protein, partial [Xenorhabdus sp. IM139775]|uniref:hypothetical protein n=1 Tax=Xenorhabdus sp. IM139775 TaxID=3025876 RepID=UPI0023583E5E
LKIEEQKEVASGTYQVHTSDQNNNNGHDSQYKWSQTNFYITLTQGYGVKDAKAGREHERFSTLICMQHSQL